MNFTTFFVLLVLLAIISPTQFFTVGNRLIAAVYPLAEAGLTLAIVIAAIAFVLKGKW